MSTQVLRRRVPLASGSAAVHAAVRGEEGALPPPITFPPEDVRLSFRHELFLDRQILMMNKA